LLNHYDIFKAFKRVVLDGLLFLFSVAVSLAPHENFSLLHQTDYALTISYSRQGSNDTYIRNITFKKKKMIVLLFNCLAHSVVSLLNLLQELNFFQFT